jgi:hypothetical protein
MAMVWKCPACHIDNAGPLEQGCSACGAGKPGVHLATAPASATADDAATQAFVDWTKAQKRSFPPDLTALCWSAFKAGLDFAVGQGVPISLPGSAETRTLHAALALFIDNVLLHDPEEVQSGEWLSAAEARKLLARLEAKKD